MEIIKYDLDPTGFNPKNKVSELHNLSDQNIRVVTPREGAFYGHNLVIVDATTDKPLIPNVQYEPEELAREPTMLYAKEIWYNIVITDRTVSNRVRIEYTALGGPQTTINTKKLYEILINDQRPVDWVTGVFNKPLTLPATLHEHILDDVYGFQPVVFALERVRNAILLSHVPELDNLLNWIMEQINRIRHATLAEYNKPNRSNHIVDINLLKWSLMKRKDLNACIIEVSSFVEETLNTIRLNLQVTVECMLDHEYVYWKLEPVISSNLDYPLTQGKIKIQRPYLIMPIDIYKSINILDKSFKINLYEDVELTKPVSLYELEVKVKDVYNPNNMAADYGMGYISRLPSGNFYTNLGQDFD